MKAKTIITIALLIFVLGSVAFLIAGESRQKSDTSDSKAKETTMSDGPTSSSSPSSHKVIAYYFHGRARCPSCLKIESYTKEAIDRDFSDELKKGRLEWRPINVDEPENSHFIQDYKLYTKSVVIANLRDGKQTQWKNLEKVWEFLYSKEVFLNYISDEVNAYLGET